MAEDIPDMGELRRLRLARFEKNGSKDSNNDKEETRGEPPRKRSRPESSAGHKSDPPQKKPISANADVIDLCDDSTDDDGSVIEIIEQQRTNTKRSISKNQSTKSIPSSQFKPASAAKSSTDLSSWIDGKRRFQVATYNIWFGPEGDGQPHIQQRMGAIASLLAQQHSGINPLWFVGFQEVVHSTQQVLHPLMESKGYEIISQPLLAYGVSLAVLTRANCPCPEILDKGYKPYFRSQMDRGFSFAHCRLPGVEKDECIVANTHLESFVPGDNGSSARVVQVKEAASFCLHKMSTNSRIKVAIIMGDLNWDDASRNPKDPDLLGVLNGNQSNGVHGEWVDSWKETVVDPKDPGYTYDSKVNPMLRGSLRRRFDRVLVFRRKGDKKICCSTTCIGTEGLGTTFMKVNHYVNPPTSRETPTAPSDHFGLVSRLALDQDS